MEQVSILVLMDFALKPEKMTQKLTLCFSFNPCFDGFCSKTFFHRTSIIVEQVSILVLMDFALKHHGRKPMAADALGFNPCFDGFCSKTRLFSSRRCLYRHVSILVLMDFALKHRCLLFVLHFQHPVSILVLMDFALKLLFCAYYTAKLTRFQSLF